MTDAEIRPLSWPADQKEWLRLRGALFDEEPPDILLAEALEFLEEIAAGRAAVFVAEVENGRLAGFAEVGQRSHAEGCTSSPVAYLESWCVDEERRRAGIGGRLMVAVEEWARGLGLRELGSDALLDNSLSLAAHTALGFVEVGQLITFYKALD